MRPVILWTNSCHCESILKDSPSEPELSAASISIRSISGNTLRCSFTDSDRLEPLDRDVRICAEGAFQLSFSSLG